MLLAVIVALCAFASPSLANPVWPHLQEGMTAPAGSELKEGRNSAGPKSVRKSDDEDRGGRSFGGGKNAAELAERYLGTNPTKMRRLWCANFMGMIEKKAGRAGTGSNMARSYASYGKAVSRSQVRPGDIAVLSRGKRGGHVGYFVGWAGNGKAILISGNSRGGKVAKGQYAVGRVIAWRRPA
jgi:uncharacterized protein (TIGR02594 family)